MLDISKKIDKLNLEILKTVKETADNLNIEFFLCGATVRDMILNYIYDIKIYRGTNDIDFAVRLENWEQYDLLVKEIEQKGFKKDQIIMHRYRYKGMIIDFIPFGDVSSKAETIVWPDKEQKEMNVIGFSDVNDHAEELLIQDGPQIVIQTASVEGLALLKLFAWNDRSANLRIKDAKDLYIIITTYLDAGNQEKLFNENTDIVDEDFDYELGGARLLGRDIARIASAHALKALSEILNNTNKRMELSQDMAQYEFIHIDDVDQKVEKCRELLSNLVAGLTDGK